MVRSSFLDAPVFWGETTARCTYVNLVLKFEPLTPEHPCAGVNAEDEEGIRGLDALPPKRPRSVPRATCREAEVAPSALDARRFFFFHVLPVPVGWNMFRLLFQSQEDQDSASASSAQIADVDAADSAATCSP